MVNASTRFNDGFELASAAEIGISTDRFHVARPVRAARIDDLQVRRDRRRSRPQCRRLAPRVASLAERVTYFGQRMLYGVIILIAAGGLFWLAYRPRARGGGCCRAG